MTCKVNFSPAPIAVFAFNRPKHLQQTIEALSANDLAIQSHVTFFCDGPRDSIKYPEDPAKCAAVRKIALLSSGFASVKVVERKQNIGCANSVIDGLTQMFAKHERLIVIEDDILTSPYTLLFLNEGLERYANYRTVFNISAWSFPPHLLPRPKGYTFDVYCVPRFNCWGWASWRDRFQNIDWEVKNFVKLKNSVALQRALCEGGDDAYRLLDMQMRGEIDSWALRANWWRFCNKQVGINPLISYTSNIGFGSGTHTTEEDHRWDNDLQIAMPPHMLHWPSHIVLNEEIKRIYKANYSPPISILRLFLLPLRFILAMFGMLPLARTIKRALLTKVKNANPTL